MKINEEFWQSLGTVIDILPEEIEISRFVSKTKAENVTLLQALRLVAFGELCGFICEGVFVVSPNVTNQGDYLLAQEGVVNGGFSEKPLHWVVKWKEQHSAQNIGRALKELKNEKDTAYNNVREFISGVLGHAVDGSNPSDAEVQARIPGAKMALETAAYDAVRRNL